MKQLKRSLQIIVLSLVIVLGFKVCVQAAGSSISFSDPKAKKGEKISVTVKVTSGKEALGAVDLTLVYDDEALEFSGGGAAVQGGSGSIRIADTASASNTKTMTYELTFTALKAGKSSITVSNYEVVNFDETVATVNHVGSSSVQVTDEEVSLSRDASLKQLKISNGTLSPAFSPSIMKYTASVGADVTSLVVSGTTTNSKAEITSITGADSLKDGENTIKVSVTAESGATAVYTITVTKEASTTEVIEEKPENTETPEPTSEGTVTPEPTGEGTVTPEPTGEEVQAGFTVQVNDKTLTPVALPEGAELKGYSVGSLEYNGESIEALVSDYMELYVINMADTEGNEDYYVYYKDVDQFTEFIKIDNGDGKFIVVLDGYPRDISVYGFERTTILINDKKVGIAWKYTDELIAYSNAAAEYYLVGGLSDSGVNTWYVFDYVEKTYQRYFVQPANLIEEETGPDLTLTEQEQQVKELNDALQKAKSDRLMVIVILAMIALALLLATVNLILKVRVLKEDIADLEEEVGEGGNTPVQKEDTPQERRTVKRERVVKPRAPKQDRNRQEEVVEEDTVTQEEYSEEIHPTQNKVVKERKNTEESPKKQMTKTLEKRNLDKAEKEFFDEAASIPKEVEDEIIKEKIHGSEMVEAPATTAEKKIAEKKPIKTEKKLGVEKPVRVERTVKTEKTARPERVVRPEKVVKPEKTVRTEKPAKSERVVRTEKVVKPERIVRTEKTAKPEKTVRTEKPAKPVRTEKPEKMVKTQKVTKAVRTARPPKTSEEIEKDFKVEDFDFEFINLDDE